MAIAVVFLGALLVATVLRLASARAVFRWVWDPADPSLRGALILGALSAVSVACRLSWTGLSPPAALILGLVLGFGVLVACAGILGIEGALLETGSAGIARRLAGTPPPTSATGRAVAVLLGTAVVGAAVALLTWLG